MTIAIALVIAGHLDAIDGKSDEKEWQKVESYHPLTCSEGVFTFPRLELYIIIASFGKFLLALCHIVHFRSNFSLSLLNSGKYLSI